MTYRKPNLFVLTFSCVAYGVWMYMIILPFLIVYYDSNSSLSSVTSESSYYKFVMTFFIMSIPIGFLTGLTLGLAMIRRYGCFCQIEFMEEENNAVQP
jgi:hypothetical protein